MTPIIFDFDDTLIVSRTDRALRLIEALEQFGLDVNLSNLDGSWGLPFRKLVESLAPALGDDFQKFLLHYVDILQRNPPEPCPGVIRGLPLLCELGPLFVHSSSYGLLIRTDLQSMGVLSLFEFVCGSDWQTRPKPDVDSISVIVKLLMHRGVQLRSCIYVGDSPGDLALAQAAGLRFVGAGFSPSAIERLETVCNNEFAIIETLDELIPLATSWT
jgi:phosphoglycolate phosphatase-like HAD superfamily hydrolase